jgi:hypothetical protein
MVRASFSVLRVGGFNTDTSTYTSSREIQGVEEPFSQGFCIIDQLVQWLSETIVFPDQMKARKCYSHSEAQQGSLEPM